jgi:uncharacterized repeat protein (TIGR01451 family)
MAKPMAAIALAVTTALAGCKTQQPAPKSEPAPLPAATHKWPTRGSDANWAWSSMAYPTGDHRTSAVGVEKIVPREARMGAPLEYEIVVTNLTGNQLDGVVVTDQPNNAFKFTKSTPEAIANANGLTWNLGDFKSHESKSIKVFGTATAEGTITSCASVTYSSMLCMAIPVVSPKLKIVQTGPTEVLRCDEIVYNIEVSNTGTGTLTGVRVMHPAAAGLKTSDGKDKAEFNVGNLNAGESKKFTTRFKADKPGKYDQKATASTEGGLTGETAVLTVLVKEPMLKVERKCAPKQYVGRALDHSVTVTNTGDAASRDTVIEETIPTGTTFVSASDGGKMSGGKVIWNLGTLEPKASKTVNWSANPGGPGVYSGTSTARGYCAAAVTDTCQSEVTGIPAILLEVVDVSDPVKVGENETYVITVTNQGTAADTNIKIKCMLEPNQQFVSAGGATNGTASGNTITFAPVPSLGPKERATFRVVVKNVKAGDVRFKATMNSDQLTRDVEETEATNVYEQ